MSESNEPRLEAMADEVRAVLRAQQGRSRLTLALRIGAALVVVALLGWWFRPQDEAPRWRFATVDRGDMVLTATATGNLEPDSEISVGAEISGLVREVLVSQNDPVTKGQVLARFDTDTLTVALQQVRAQLAVARAAVEEADATLAEAKLDETRKQTLVQDGTLPRSELDAAVAARKRAAARLDSSRASVRQAEAAVSEAQTRLDKAVIRSPIDGVVLKRSVEPGNTVAASFQAPELFILAEDLSHMELHVAVDEADVGLVAAGQSARFTVDAWPDRDFEARVEKVYLSPTVENNVVTYTTVLTVDNGEGLLRPGMTATATITTGTRRDILRVPNAALRFEPPKDRSGGFMMGPPGMRRADQGTTGSVVWTLVDGAPHRVPLRTGYSDGRFTEVLGGEVKAGDRLLTGEGAGSAVGRPAP